MLSAYIFNAFAFTIFLALVVFAIFPSTLSKILSRFLSGDYDSKHTFSSAADEDRISEEIISQKAILEGIFKG